MSGGRFAGTPEEIGVGLGRLKGFLPKEDSPLPMDDASRMARAAQMGFRTGMPVYHGTGADISAFRAVPTTSGGMETPGVSLALDPAVANEFAESAPSNPSVYPLVHRADRPVAIDLHGDETHGEVVGALRDAFDSGYDAVMVGNYTTPKGKRGQKIIIVKSPDQLRSRYAVFDPAKKSSSDILSVTGVPIFRWKDDKPALLGPST